MILAPKKVIHSKKVLTNRPLSKRMDDQFTYEEERDGLFSSENALNLLMTGKLIYIGYLKEMFGYSDYRAIEKWLRENNIVLLKLGRKKYAVSLMIDAFIQQEIRRNLNKSYEDSESMMEAIENDDLEYLINLTAHEAKNDSKRNKKQRGKGSQSFTDRLKDVE